jgi:hypothetical protein
MHFKIATSKLTFRVAKIGPVAGMGERLSTPIKYSGSAALAGEIETINTYCTFKSELP